MREHLELDCDRPADCLTAALHHLVIGSPDPASASDYYAKAMGYAIDQSGPMIVGRAPGRCLGFTTAPLKTLVEAGFALPDHGALDRLRNRLLAAGQQFSEGASEFFEIAIRVVEPDGTPLSFGIPKDAREPVGGSERDARLQHVVRASTDPGRVARFFVDVLGFTVSDNVLDDDGDLRACFLRCSAEHHSFAVFKANSNWFDHHCYETSDWNMIRDWADHFAAERIALEWGPGRHGPGNNLFIFVHDPDGNWVELSAELDLLPHDTPSGEWRHEERTLNSWGKGKLRS